MATNNQIKNYYKILGLNKGASDDEIKKAFRTKARQYHPDMNKGEANADEKFKELNEAYEILGDVEKRKKYDKYGARYRDYEQWEKAGGAATGVPFESFFNQSAGASGGQYRAVNVEDLGNFFKGGNPFSDILNGVFSGNNPNSPFGTGRPQTQSRDPEYAVEITLEEAATGTKRVLELEGQAGKPRRLEVSIPAGVDNGSRVRLAGLGSPASVDGVAASDLYLLVSVLPNARYERKGSDLYLKMDVPLEIMLLGGEVAVPTIFGKRLGVKLAAGTQNGAGIRLKNQGMPRVIGKADERGDLYLQPQTQIPNDLTDEERQLLEKFAQLRRVRHA